MYNQTLWIVFLLVHEMSDGDDIEQLRQLIDGARAQRAGAQMDGRALPFIRRSDAV